MQNPLINLSIFGMCIAPSKFLLLTSEGAASPDGATPRNALNSEVSMNFDLVMLCTYYFCTIFISPTALPHT